MGWRERLDNDMAKAFAADFGPAEDVAVIAADLATRAAMRGFFEWPTVDADPSTARVASAVRAPMLTLLVRDVKRALGRKIARGDFVDARGSRFRVEVVRPDGIGAVVLKLKEISGEAA